MSNHDEADDARQNETEQDAGRRIDEERNDRAAAEIDAASRAHTRDLAEAIARRMGEAPGVEHDLDDVRGMVPGMSATGARAALSWLARQGRVEEIHGYYRLAPR